MMKEKPSVAEVVSKPPKIMESSKLCKEIGAWKSFPRSRYETWWYVYQHYVNAKERHRYKRRHLGYEDELKRMNHIVYFLIQQECSGVCAAERSLENMKFFVEFFQDVIMTDYEEVILRKCWSCANILIQVETELGTWDIKKFSLEECISDGSCCWWIQGSHHHLL